LTFGDEHSGQAAQLYVSAFVQKREFEIFFAKSASFGCKIATIIIARPSKSETKNRRISNEKM